LGVAPDLTVAANLFLGREILRKGLLGFFGFLANKEVQERARKELERLGIAAPAPNQPVSKLSGGQRQAVAIGRAVAWAKKVIILDEPTNHLGVRQSAEVLDVIRQARQKGLAVVFISHTLPHVPRGGGPHSRAAAWKSRCRPADIHLHPRDSRQSDRGSEVSAS
jgi:simple sugar transport system ATP-binding protein